MLQKGKGNSTNVTKVQVEAEKSYRGGFKF